MNKLLPVHIYGLESRLIGWGFKLLRQQCRDQMPEVSFIADQVKELQTQISEERLRSISKNGRLSLVLFEAGLIADVTFATEPSAPAADNAERVNELKFMVDLGQPQMPASYQRWQAFHHSWN